MHGDPPLTDSAVAAVLASEWGLSPSDVRYEPVGYGGYHWLATVGGASWFVTADPADRPVRECYELARRLADDGLTVVRPPKRTLAGAVVCPVDGWWVSVWPWLEGRCAPTLRHRSAADVAAVGAALRRLHDHAAEPPGAPLVEDWSIAGWERLVAVLDRPGRAAGPYAADMLSLLAASRQRLSDMKERYAALVAGRLPAGAWTVTHGEPHAANVVHTAAGAVLIDWDTVRWAPRERDLWLLAGYPDWQAGYGPADPDPGLLAAYRLRWHLTDVALFVPDLLEAATPTPDLDVAMREVRRYLAPD